MELFEIKARCIQLVKELDRCPSLRTWFELDEELGIYSDVHKELYGVRCSLGSIFDFVEGNASSEFSRTFARLARASFEADPSAYRHLRLAIMSAE